MIIDLDFDGVEAAKPFEPLTSGVYDLIVDNAEILDSVNSTEDRPIAPNFKLTFNVEGYDNKVWHQFNLGPKSKPYILQFLQAIFGDAIPNPLRLTSDEERAEFCAMLIGMGCEAIVEKTARKNTPVGEPVKYGNTVTAFNPK